jgi:hypothetical protein
MATDLSQLLANPELAGFDRQRQMAQLLLQRGQKTPQGQMIGNIYVGASPYEFLGNMAQQYVGQQQLKDIDQQELASALRLRKQDIEDLQSNMQLYRGTPEKSLEMAGPYGQGVGAEGANVPMPTAYTPAQAANPQLAMANLLASPGPKSSAMGADLYKQMFKEPKWEKSERPDGNGNIEYGYVNVNSQNPISTFIVGGKKPDIEQAKGQWEGYLPQSGGLGPTSIAGKSSFAPAMAKVFSLEGEAFVPKDGLSGAPAKFGINQKANPDIDVKNLTKPQAEAIYKTRYWDAIGGDNLPPKTAEIAFDAAVNQGPNYAKQLLAQTGGDPQKMLQQRAQDYAQLVQSDPRQAQYLPSWMNRLTVLAKDTNTGVNPAAQTLNTTNLPPKEAVKLAAEAAKTQLETDQANFKSAKDVFGVTKQIATLLPQAHGSGIGNIIGGAANFVGIETEKNKADAQLKVLGSKILMNTPRFQGPQSDKDVATYKEAAGQIGDSSIPAGVRMAALQTIVDLNKQYAPNLNWDSVLPTQQSATSQGGWSVKSVK